MDPAERDEPAGARRPAPDLAESVREIGAAGRASIAAATDAAKALRSLLAADMALARSAMGRTMIFAGVAIVFGAAAWLLLVSAMVLALAKLGLSLLAAVLVGAAISLAVTGYAGWRAAHYFDYTRLEATRRHLARLGIGELVDLMSGPDDSARPAHGTHERSENDAPPPDRRGVDTPPP